MTTTRVNLENIARAATLIDPVFRDSPQFADDSLSAALGRQVLVKVETANPVRSFKGRGTDFLVQSLDPKQKIVCASAGNFGQAMAYTARKRNIAVEVFVPTDVNPMKAARIKSFGAKLTVSGEEFELAKNHARQHAAQHLECVFIEDGDNDAITEGAGTIGVELLKADAFDTVVVPVGDGALINGMAAWIKEHAPQTKIVGVCPSGGSAMYESWRKGRPVTTESSNTIADGIAVRVPVPKSVEQMKKLVDDLVLVDDDSLISAMQLAASTLGLILEPSGAAGLAAIQVHHIPGDRIATVLTGSNVHPGLLPRVLSSPR